MNHGALPALGTGRSFTLMACATIALLGATACSERSTGAESFVGLPSFTTNDQEHDSDENRPARATATGRIDFPPGGPERNRRPSKDKYQTFSFHIRDRNSDSIPDQWSKLQFIDHRKTARVNGKERKLVAVSWGTFIPEPPSVECPDGAVTVTGFVDNKATPAQENLSFTLRVCDVEDPGHREPNDTFLFSVPGLGPDPDTNESYRMHFHDPFGPDATGAYLTGGNIQVKNTDF